MNAELRLIQLFQGIRDKGWIATKRHGDQCLGNTFEDLIGKAEDNKSEADFCGIELKSHRTITQSMVSLFSKSPSSPKGVNTYLREKYGVSENLFGMKVLNTTISGARENTHRGGHGFMAVVNRTERRIYLQVRNLKTSEIIPEDVYWDFSILERALEKKLSKIAIFYGDEKDEGGIHYVRYTKMLLFSGLTIEKMLRSVEVGDLKIDIRIGVYHSGKNEGKTHDHGTAFRIQLNDLLKYGEVTEY